jgi:hypothetical protein
MVQQLRRPAGLTAKRREKQGRDRGDAHPAGRPATSTLIMCRPPPIT